MRIHKSVKKIYDKISDSRSSALKSNMAVNVCLPYHVTVRDSMGAEMLTC